MEEAARAQKETRNEIRLVVDHHPKQWGNTKEMI
jgi:hypothetical protein